jgi:hypothetical protein
MNKVLVNLDYCYADEFNVNGLWVTTLEAYENFLDELEDCEINDDTEIYFGTNEFIIFESYEDITDSLVAKLVSDEFYNDFIKYIGSDTYGIINIPELIERFKD